mmetsp:Transcript_13347/g.30724  ORF Transcript_13347/g.30724 Transcript_13347/m.30724 type:complete len:287 (-) Transcript_13347:169-1029(-)
MNTVANTLATTGWRNRQEPGPGIVTEDLPPVLLPPQIKGVDLILLSRISLFYMLNRAHVLEKKHVMEPSEPREHHSHSHHEAEDNKVLKFHHGELDGPVLDQRCDEADEDGAGHVEGSDCGIRAEQDEVLVVAVTDAVVNPGTMMVHLQDTSSTILAVMRSVRLELPALAAVPLPSIQLPLRTRDSQGRVLVLVRHFLRDFSLQPKSMGQIELGDPRFVELIRNSPSVCEDDLPVADQHEDEQDVETDQQRNAACRVGAPQRQCSQEDEAVVDEGDDHEDNDGDEE